MRSFLLLPALFFSLVIQAQSSNALLKLRLTDMAGKPLPATVSFLQKSTGKSFRFTTDANGLADCPVPANNQYGISIPGSEDSYDYNLGDFGGETLPLALQFEAVATGSFATFSNALLTLRLFNNPGVGPYAIKSISGFKKEALIENDSSYVQLPVAQSYELNIPGIAIANNTISVGNGPYQVIYYVLYFHDDKKAELVAVDTASSILHLTYKDLYSLPVPGEKLIVKSGKTGKQYTATTAPNGAALLVVPKNDHYTISLKYFSNYAHFDTQEKASFISNSVTVFYPSSLQQERRKAELARELVKRDSLYGLRAKSQELSGIALATTIREAMPVMLKSLNSNPLYFVEQKNEVCAVLYRNRHKWQTRTIVTDVTGSMYPYMKQVAVWHFLESMNKERSGYVFFNDGDDKRDDEKLVGKTGGLYSSLSGTPDSLLRIMFTAMHNGSGGDGPENDVEALEKGQAINPPQGELVLVADNYSPVKDMELLSRINKPVHIILCGAVNSINLDCLQIAYQTGGSIHTIEEDIEQLSALHDEEKIKLLGNTYQLIKGRFFPVTETTL